MLICLIRICLEGFGKIFVNETVVNTYLDITVTLKISDKTFAKSLGFCEHTGRLIDIFPMIKGQLQHVVEYLQMNVDMSEKGMLKKLFLRLFLG